ncbi:uncharacterized protein LOC108098471 [Drosophila ficusphila]|uniref:uncharacterized protein LOC108098471 n=1 Tax=Drosophila ficusphila TaxID=30025 RepID=UPI0007E66F0F|nr:uncharacterized protein LOC108098471 [Drosophila ficusphila]
MKAICALVILALLAAAFAAPAPAPSPGNEPTVSVLRYSNDQDLENIQRAIIAQYERIGGRSEVHAPQVARVVDLRSLGVNV